MRLAKYVKAATDRKRYQIDYTNWLDTGESVSGAVFSVPNNTAITPLVVNDVAVLPTGLGVQYYVSGGVDGVTYNIDVQMTTLTGPQIRLDDILMTIREP